MRAFKKTPDIMKKFWLVNYTAIEGTSRISMALDKEPSKQNLRPVLMFVGKPGQTHDSLIKEAQKELQ